MFIRNLFRSRRRKHENDNNDCVIREDEIDALANYVAAGPEDIGVDEEQWSTSSFFYLLEKRFGVRSGIGKDDDQTH